jgi:hypothetical protein
MGIRMLLKQQRPSSKQLAFHTTTDCEPSMRAITICTSPYAKHTRRLVTSYNKHHPGSSITVYCDNASRVSKQLSGLDCEVLELNSINTLGVKRAKFEAYVLAAQQGGFLYLDSDIIILRSLNDLHDHERLVACPDDLSECDFVSDKSFPWPNSPELKAKTYINSGIMFFPQSLLTTLEEIYQASIDDELWSQFIFPGKLYDNHFLCAYLNLKDVPVRFVDPYAYNWQGLRKGDKILAEIQDDTIISTLSGGPLYLMHFAGISDIDSFLLQMSPDILQKLSATATEEPIDILKFFQSRGVLRTGLMPDIAREIACLITSDKDVHGMNVNLPSPYIPNAGSFLSFSLSETPSDVRWNGLPCGGAYFNAQEYNFLRSVVRTKKLQSVIEIGGGYTSVLLTNTARKVLSIEAYQGPWLDAAIARGCDVEHVPFIAEARRFDQTRLEQAIQKRKLERPDLLFIDSPNGTTNRDGALRQLEELLEPRFIAFHDARRDSDMIFEAMLRLGYRLDTYLASYRGFVVLAAPSEEPLTLRSPTVDTGDFAFTAEVLEWRSVKPDSMDTLHKVRLINTGERTIAISGEDRLLLSYHVVDANGQALHWDNPRTALPCDLEPGDELVLDVVFSRCDAVEPHFFFDLVCEGRYWISHISPHVSCDPMLLKTH